MSTSITPRLAVNCTDPECSGSSDKTMLCGRRAFEPFLIEIGGSSVGWRMTGGVADAVSF